MPPVRQDVTASFRGLVAAADTLSGTNSYAKRMSDRNDRPRGRARDRGPDAERLFRTALDLVSSGVVLADGDGRIVLANQQLEQQFGYPHGELIGQAGRDASSPTRCARRAAANGASSRRRPRRQRRRCRPVRAAPGRLPVPGGSHARARCTPTTAASCSHRSADVHDATQAGAGPRDAVTGQREFERLIADMSAQFINLPPEGGGRRHPERPDADRPDPRPRSRDLLPHRRRMACWSIRWAGTATPCRRFPIRCRPRASSRGPSRRCRPARWCASPASTRFPIRSIGRAIAASASARRSRCRWRSPAGSSAPWGSTRFDGSAPGRRTNCTCSACSPRPSATCWPAARATRPCAQPTPRSSRLRDQLHAENVVPACRSPRPLGHRQRHRRKPGDPPDPRAGRAGRGHRFDRAAARRDRHRQGAVRVADPRPERAARAGHGAGELRGDSGDAGRKRAVRP